MKSVLRHLSISASRPGSGWLTLLLLLAVLVPSGCLVWFMRQAVRNEQLAMRQQMMDVCHDHLALAHNQLDACWINAARFFDTNDLPAPALFAAAVSAGVADAVIIFDSAGKPAYPASGFVPEQIPAAPSASNATLAARAFQAQARRLAQDGNKEAVIALVTNSTLAPAFTQAADEEGRLIVPSAELLALESGADAGQLAGRLRGELLDYGLPMPASQRRFLMRRMEQLFPRQAAFPTLAAEDLAAFYLENKPTNVWPIAAANGRALMLFSGESLPRRLSAALGPGIELLPPGHERKFLAADAAGTNLPGFQLIAVSNDRRLFETAAEAQIAAYFWVAMLALASVAVLAAIAVQLIRRQARTTQLRNDLVANVTHELKTPLSSMRLLVDTLLNSPVLHEPTAREYLQLIATENRRLSRLIDNFLAFSRMERNKYAFDFATTRPEDIVDSAAAAVRERFQPPACHFQALAAPDLPAVAADAGALVTALLNLLDNAYKYSGDQKEITLRATAGDNRVTFAVSDNGIGLAPRETRRIFKRFYQVNQPQGRTGGGCGLGLSIVRFIVTAHHGTVRVESRPGSGSTFTISIPAARAAATQEAP